MAKLAVMEGNAGTLSKQVHMEAENALQVTKILSKKQILVQFQEEGIKYANILYSRNGHALCVHLIPICQNRKELFLPHSSMNSGKSLSI